MITLLYATQQTVPQVEFVMYITLLYSTLSSGT